MNTLNGEYNELTNELQSYNEALAELAAAEANLQSCESAEGSDCLKPPPRPVRRRGKQQIPNQDPADPNDLIGPTGFGAQAFVDATGPLGYTVQFENDGDAAAQDVTVTEQLDANLDWSTFQLGSFGFGAESVTIPAGLTQYQTTIAYQNTDGSALNVQVCFDFNEGTGLLSVTYTSLDPNTGEAPTGVYDGFLPPNDSSNVGEGFVQYTVKPKANLSTGAIINQQASVVFDINPALATNTVSNAVAAIATQTNLSEPAGATTPTATKISTLLGTYYVDPDPNTKPGIAVIGTSGTGAWQYSANGTSWTSIPAVATTNAFLLPQADQLRFLPTGTLGGRAELIFVAWDGSVGSAGGFANTTLNGGGAPFSTNAGTLTVTVTPVNHAPTWSASTATFTPVLPGTYSLTGATPAGDLVSNIFAAAFNDVDGNSVGIAVTGVTGTNHGAWQFSADGGTTWTSFGTATTSFKVPALTNALLLAGTDLIRFVPSAGFTGAATLTANAWDGTQGTAAATGAAAGFKITATGGANAFSATTLTATVEVNTAPTLELAAITASSAIVEGAASAAVTAKTLLTDAGANAHAIGMAIVGASGTGDSGTGTWLYQLAGTTTWTPLPAVSETSGFLLPSTASVRFQSVANQNGTARLTFYAWDGTAGAAGKLVAIAATGGATSFSGTTATASLNVTAVNHAPTWTATTAALPAAQGNSTPPGVLVSAIFGSYFSDSDGNPVGIAVIGAAGTNGGTWEYYLNDSTWTTFGAATTTFKVPAVTNALLLPAGAFIRFVPKTGFLGTASLTVLAWDGAQAAPLSPTPRAVSTSPRRAAIAPSAPPV